ncbi:MAG: hypothetical protein MUE98_13440 [Rhodobacteraceae bacterium]|nr:hypothetical protein [Paracoccaceae bacterium]
MRRYLAVIPFALAGCAVDPQAGGIVTSFNGQSVELQAAFPWDGNFASTPGLDRSAREVCPNARWIGFRDDGQQAYITHIYRCE